MTLIIGSSRPGAALMFGDTLLSYDARVSSNVELPSQFLRASQIGEKGIAGLAQKLIFLSPNLVVGWAGGMTRAQAAIRRLALLLDGETSFASLQRVLEQDVELQTLVSEVELIFLGIAGERRQEGLPAQVGGINAHRSGPGLFTAGSGAYHFLHLVSERRLSVDASNENKGEARVLADELSALGGRFASMILREAFDETPLNFGYGGAFEIVIADDSNRLAKLPYTLVYWLMDQDRLVLRGPVIKVGYVANGTMVVDRFPLATTEAHTHATFEITSSLPEFGHLHYSAAGPSIYFHAVVSRDDMIVLTQLSADHDFRAQLDPLTRHMSVFLSAAFQAHIRQVTGAETLHVAGQASDLQSTPNI
jgi:hypothetical protein